MKKFFCKLKEHTLWTGARDAQHTIAELFRRIDSYCGIGSHATWVAETLARLLIHVEFGLTFLWATYIYIYLCFGFTGGRVYGTMHDHFHAYAAIEIGMFLALFLCFLAFFVPIKRSAALGGKIMESNVKGIFFHNCASVFAGYFIIIGLNVLSSWAPYSFPFFWRIFYSTEMNWRSAYFSMCVVKLFYITLVLFGLYIVFKYFNRNEVGYHFFCLAALLSWGGLFLMSMSNMLYIILVLDGVSLLLVGFAALNVFGDNDRVIGYSLHYYLLSIFTSILAYIGCFLIYTVTQTLNIGAIAFMSTNSTSAWEIMHNNPWLAAGGLLIITKIIFLLGLFPFQRYVLDLCASTNYGFIFFFLVIVKLPVLVITAQMLKVFWLAFDYLSIYIFVVGGISILFSAVYMVNAKKMKHFLALSSINQIGFVFILFAFREITSVYTAFGLFAVYAVASAAILLFFASVSGHGVVGDFESMPEVAKFMTSSMIWFMRHRGFERPDTSMYFFFGTIVTGTCFVILAGLPPFAGFFMKLAFIEIFIEHGAFGMLGATMLLTAFSIFAYVNVLCMLCAECDYAAAGMRGGRHATRVMVITGLDAIVFGTIFTIAVLISFAISDGSAVWEVSYGTSMFTDNHLYWYTQLLDHCAPQGTDLQDSRTANDGGYVNSVAPFFLFAKKMLDKVLLPLKSLFADIKLRSQNFFYYSLDYCQPVILGFLSFVWVISMLHVDKSNWSFQDNLEFDLSVRHFVILVLMMYFINYFVYYALLGKQDYHYVMTSIMAVIWLCSPGFAEFCWAAVSEIFQEAARYVGLGGLLDYCSTVDFWYKFMLVGTGTFGVIVIAILVWCFLDFRYSIYFTFAWDNHVRDNIDALQDYVRHTIEAFATRFRHIVGYPILIYFVAFVGFGPHGTEFSYTPEASATQYLFLVIVATLRFYTINYRLVTLAVMCLFMHLLYCYVMEINSVDQFKAHVADIEAQAWAKTNYARYALYLFFACILPISWALEFPWGGALRFFYFNWLFEIHQLVMGFWLVGLFFLAVHGFGRNSEDNYVLTIFYLAMSIVLFFVNICVAYATLAMTIGGEGAGERAPFVGFDSYKLVKDQIPAIVRENILLQYDFLAALLCLMTALVFAFVFYVLLFSEKVERKKLFFSLLLIIEIFALLTILSTNILCFIVFFECSLIPMALIVGSWGSSAKKWHAARLFVLYSVVSSLPALVAVVYLYKIFGTVSYVYVLNNIFILSGVEKFFLWAAFFLVFAVKIPLFPFHSWLLNAHVEAPMGGSIVLAAVLLKLGFLGLIRFPLGLFHDVSTYMAPAVIFLALGGIFYSAVLSISEVDAKRLVALTSIAHMGMCVVGLFMFDALGFYGAILLALGHAVVSTALFFIVGIMYERFQTRDINALGGLVHVMPLFSTAFFFFAVANSGFPCSLSFLGEFFIMVGTVKSLGFVPFSVILISSVLLFYSNLKMFMNICFGSISEEKVSNTVSDLTHVEVVAVITLVVYAVEFFLFNNVYFSALYTDALTRYIY